MLYLDVLLLVNFLIAYFLLLATAALTAQQASFPRMIGAGVLAAVSSLILLVPPLPGVLQLAYKIGSAAGIIAVAFGWRFIRRYITAVLWYTGLNILLAGAVMLVILQTGTTRMQTGNLAVYIRVSPLLLLTLAGACCLIIELLLRIGRRPARSEEIIGLQMEACNTTIKLRAALDTGCHLQDPISCLPVLLVSYPNTKSRLPQTLCRFLEEWYHGNRAAPLPSDVKLRVIPCATATDRTILPGIAVEEMGLITPEGVTLLGRTAVAFSPQMFGENQYEALYGTDFL